MMRPRIAAKKMFVFVTLFLSGCWALFPTHLEAAPRSGFLQRPARSGRGLIGPELYIVLTNRVLDEVAEKVRESQRERPTGPHKLLFSGNLFLAHGAYIGHFPLDAILKYADALKEAGVHRIDVNPSSVAFLDTSPEAREVTAKYDRLTQHIKDLRLQLAWNPQFTHGDMKIGSFADFEQIALRAYAEMARRYHPDVFMVIHEPTTMMGRMGIKVSPPEWANFAQKAAQVVKRESPTSRIGACGLFYERPYFDAFLAIKSIDVMALDIYDLKHLDVYNDMIRSAREAGKGVYIEETWRTPFLPPGQGSQNLDVASSSGIGEERYKQLDGKWLETMALYASAWGLEALTPFWTPTFFKYVREDGSAISYEYESKVASAVQKGERTETFRKYQEIIKLYGK